MLVHPDVQAALDDRRPVVAIETAVVTCGLAAPQNVDVARRMVGQVRDAGAVAALTGVLDGQLVVGLDDAGLVRLAERGAGRKAAARDAGGAIAEGACAGTTVSATLLAARAVEPPIRVMATGGIGGVHRGWQRRPDISGDLAELVASPVAVVCSGPKFVLDVVATYEALETLGVPCLAMGTDLAPSFYCRPGEPLEGMRRVDLVEQAAAICRAHWALPATARGVVVANPVPQDVALDPREVERILAGVASRPGRWGPARTPELLAAVNDATGGRAMQANLALLVANAALAGRLAVAVYT